MDALIVVHPTSYFDEVEEAKKAINYIAAEFLNQNKSVYTLVDATEDLKKRDYEKYFPLLNQTKIVFSKNGENTIVLNGKRFVVVGGYFYACLRTALIHLSRNNLSKEKAVIEVYLPLPAIYGKNIELSLKDKEMVKLHGWLPKDTGLTVYLNSEKRISTRAEAQKQIKVYLRGKKETPFLEGFQIQR